MYAQGNLFDFIQEQRQQWQRLAAGLARAALRRQQLREVLQLFLQVCAALHSMHSMEPPLAHRDVKPQNVLLRLRQEPDGGGSGGGGAGSAAPQQQQQQPRQGERQQWEAGEWGGGGSGGDAPGSAVVAVEEEGQQAQARWWQRRLAAWRERYEAVLMDFGSTRTARVVVRNRSEAMSVQEDAEVRRGSRALAWLARAASCMAPAHVPSHEACVCVFACLLWATCLGGTTAPRCAAPVYRTVPRL